jgi:DNA-binding Lrp family transcriptional regulator
MTKRKQNLSEIEKSVLLSLLEDGRKGDSKISREIKTSRIYVNKIRKKLEKEKLIFGYLPLIDLDKIDVKFFVTVLFQWKGYEDEKLTERMLSDLEGDSSVIYLSVGEGSGFTTHILLGFSDFSGARDYLKEFRRKYGKQLGEFISFFASGDGILKQDYTDIIKEKIKKMGEEESNQR